MSAETGERRKTIFEENPFYILHAMPTESQEELIGKAEERTLLTGEDTEEVQSALLHPKGRLLAELGFLPRTEEAQVGTIRNYLESGGRKGEPLPDFESGSILAVMNGADALLSYWPVSDAKSAAALCFSFAKTADHLSGEQAAEDLNCDREAAGLAPYTDVGEISMRLREHKALMAEELAGRCSALRREEELEMLHILADAYADPEGEYHRSQTLDELVNRYLGQKCTEAAASSAAKIRENEKAYREDAAQCPKDDLLALVRFNNEKAAWREPLIRELLDALYTWNRMTMPARKISRAKGLTQKEAHELCDLLHVFVHDMNNTCSDYQNAFLLIRALVDTFTDESADRIALMKKNLEKISRNASRVRKK